MYFSVAAGQRCRLTFCQNYALTSSNGGAKGARIPNPLLAKWRNEPRRAAFTPEQPRSRALEDAMGGIDQVVDLAETAFDSGDYRWAGTLLDHAVFVDEDHAAARTLYADTLEELAYGAENGTWRNFFLSGATELREGNFGTPAVAAAPAIVGQLNPAQLLDSLATSVNGPGTRSGPRCHVHGHRLELSADPPKRRAHLRRAASRGGSRRDTHVDQSQDDRTPRR
jgi:hypothetical protein